jgi:hypothetical protein
MNKFSPTVGLGLAITFIGGIFTHFLYQRWNSPGAQIGAAGLSRPVTQGNALAPESHPVKFSPLTAAPKTAEVPLMQARDVAGIRGLTGNRARIRGRVFRVGHSGKSNTYFLNFGPSRDALTGVIFASAVESFDKRKLAPKGYAGKEVEIEGVIRDHPQYGLEVILEDPAQIRILN